MARGFDKLFVKSAVKARNKFDLSRTHLTTLDFGQVVPLFCEETIPGDKFNIDATYFSRMAPLVKPTYGKFSFHTMSVFVPYYQISEGIDGYLSGATYWKGKVTTSRFLDMSTILGYFFSATGIGTAITASQVAAGKYYDLAYIDASGSTKYKALNAKGKFALKVLNSLGYAWHEGIDLQSSSTYSSTGLYNKNMSALPLLAFAKAFNDWMSMSQRYNESVFTKVIEAIKVDNSITENGVQYYSAAGHKITWRFIELLIDELKVCYENDYFTTAWEYPNGPSGSYGSTLTFNYQDMALGNSSAVVSNNVSSGLFDNSLSGVGSVISQRALDFLKSFDDWVRRNNYSGSRSVQQLFSRFGIKTEDYKSNFAHVIDTDIIPIQVGDVTALSQDYVGSGNTNNIQLGDYAGKGIMSGNNGFSYEASDYGMLFIFGWYTVAPMMSFGWDRHVLRTQPKEYYNPEFDGLGGEAISVGEVFSNPRIVAGTDQRDPLDTQVYGYTERYNSYRFSRDKITGDFRRYTLESSNTYAQNGTDMNTWHTGRMLTDIRLEGNLVAQNPNVLQLTNNNSEFNRMFSVTDADVDHFYMTAQFKVSAVRPMLSLNQVPRLGEGNTVIAKNGTEVN